MSNYKLEPLPHGLESEMEIYQATLMNSKNGKSTFLQLGFNIKAPGYERRRVWHKFFIKGVAGTALDVSSQLYWQLMECIGISEENEPVPAIPVGGQRINVPELVGHKIIGRVKLKQGTNGYADTNEIAFFKKHEV